MRTLSVRLWAIVAPLLLISSLGKVASADLYLSQDFSTSSTISDYVSANPGVGQFNAINSANPANMVVSIVNDDLRFDRTSSSGSFTRLALNNAASIAAVKATITLNVTSTSTTTTAATLFLGNGFNTNNSIPLNANSHSRIGFNFNGGGFQVRDIGAASSSASFLGQQTLTWFVNNTGGSLDYLNPNSGVSTLANDRAAVWLGTTQVFSSIAATTASQDIRDFKFVFDDGTGIFNFDSIQVESFSAVPEPCSLFLVACFGGGFSLVLIRHGRSKTRNIKIPNNPSVS